MKKLIFAATLTFFAIFSLVNPHAFLPLQAANTYNLVYETFGGANHASNPSSYNDEQSNFALLPASKPGLLFQGWYRSEGFREVDRVDILPGSDGGVTKLYAKFGLLNFTVDFDSNGGNDIAQQSSIPTLSQSPGPTFVGTSEASSGYTSIARDINGDGKGDFITFVEGNRHIFLSHPTLGYEYTRVNNNLINFAWGSKFIDINDDDLEDLIVLADNTAMSYSLRQPNGSLGTETLFTLQSGGDPYNETIAFDMADFDNDGDLDVAIIGNGKLVYRLNLGNFTFGPAVLLQTFGTYGRGVTIYDLTNDGHLDVVFSSSIGTFVKWGNGVTPFGGALTALSIGPYRPFISDVNKDSFHEVIGLEDNRRVPLYVSFNANLTANFFSTFPGAEDILGRVNWAGDEMDANGDGYADLFYLQDQGESGMLISRGDGTYYVQKFTTQDSSTSGTVVFDPGYGSLGVMGVGWTNPVARYYSITGSQSVSHLSSITPSRNGYTFDGWYEQSNLSGSSFNFLGPVNANKTLYAKWILNNYGITYSMNGGTNNPNNPTTLTIETAAITLQDPSKPGSRFLGWYDNAGFAGSPITTIPANQTETYQFYAKWLDPVTVSFNSNGGTAVASVTNLPGEVLTQPTNPTRNGYTFQGWFADSGFTTPYVFTTIPNQSKIIYAKWSALNFTITFETNGGSTIAPINRDTDQTLSLPTAPTKVGHAFDGWYTNQALTNRLTVSKMPPNNLTLYAKWNVNIHRLEWTINDSTYSSEVAYDATLSSVLPTPTKYQHEFLGWSSDGEEIINLTTFKMPDNPLTLTALFRDNVLPVVFTLNDGDTYAGGVDIVFNEGTALLNGQPVQSGYRVQASGTYTLVLTDDGGNVVEVTFTVIEAVDNTNLRWIIFASILTATWLFLIMLYLFNRKPSSGGPGGTLVMHTPAPKGRPVIQTKKTVSPQQPVNQATVAKTEAKPIIQPQAVPPVAGVQETKPSPQPKPVEVKKPEPKVEVKKPIDKAPPMPVVKSEEIDRQLTETVIFKNPLKVKVDPVESYTPELKQSFTDTFVSDKRAIKVPELTYVPQTTNVPFYTNLFRYIHRFAGVLTEGLLASLTQSVIKLTDDKEAQLKIVEASTRTAEGLKTNQNQDYLLKILRRNVALNRDVLNPRNKYVYSYQRLATLLEELGIYVEAVIVVREAYERGLVDTPDTTYEKRLTRLEKKLVDSGGQRQDMIRK
jgi:uncharacterized repeat protein (TIGR02543 family)